MNHFTLPTLCEASHNIDKTTTTVSLCTGLASQTKEDGSPVKVLAIDTDSQNSLGVSLGVLEADKLPYSLTNVMQSIMTEQEFDPLEGTIRHEENIHFMPSNTSLTSIELALVSVIGRETILRQYIDMVKPYYDVIVIDTSPSLDLMTINSLACANSIIIPVAPKFLDAKGLEALLKNVAQIKRQINPALDIMGILLTMVDKRTRLKKSTWFYLDELHLLLKEEQTAAYTVEFWKRFRKWGGIPSVISQNVKDFLLSPECQNIFENSDFVYLLNQAAGDRQILAKQLGISPHQLSYVTHANEGEGLLIYNGMIIPFKDKFPKDGIGKDGVNGGKNEIYALLTTKPSEV